MIYLAGPWHYGVDPKTAEAFWDKASQRPKSEIVRHVWGTSLLAHSFNHHWANALNFQKEGQPITHFAMLHSDIVPDPWWLDTLIEDMQGEEYADVVAAVVPIKDALGLTSTAIDDADDHFAITRRLTMKEVYRLPPVFGSYDCGYPERALLVNTGCWICDFTKPWRERVKFTIHDALVKSKQTGFWEVKVCPEDWNFSRQLHRMGCRVLATRRVGLSHMGTIPFSNREAWGLWEYDRILGHKFGERAVQAA